MQFFFLAKLGGSQLWSDAADCTTPLNPFMSMIRTLFPRVEASRCARGHTLSRRASTTCALQGMPPAGPVYYFFPKGVLSATTKSFLQRGMKKDTKKEKERGP